MKANLTTRIMTSFKIKTSTRKRKVATNEEEVSTNKSLWKFNLGSLKKKKSRGYRLHHLKETKTPREMVIANGMLAILIRRSLCKQQ